MEPLILLQFEPRPLKTKYRKKTLWRRPPLDYQAFFGSCQEKRATAFSSAQLASQLTSRLSNSNSLSPVMLHIFLASYPDSARMQSHHFPLTAYPLLTHSLSICMQVSTFGCYPPYIYACACTVPNDHHSHLLHFHSSGGCIFIISQRLDDRHFKVINVLKLTPGFVRFHWCSFRTNMVGHTHLSFTWLTYQHRWAHKLTLDARTSTRADIIGCNGRGCFGLPRLLGCPK